MTANNKDKLLYNSTQTIQQLYILLRIASCRRNYKYIVAGPQVFICNECVEVCNGYIADAEQALALKKRRSDYLKMGDFLPIPTKISLAADINPNEGAIWLSLKASGVITQ